MNEDAHPWKAIRDTAAGFTLSLAMLPGLVIASNTQRGVEGAGFVVVTQAGDNFSLKNHAIGATWSVTEGKVNSLVVTDRMHGTELRVAVPFAILLENGTIYNGSILKLSSQPAKHELTPRRRQTAWRTVRLSIGKQRPFPAGSVVAHSS